MEAHMSSPIAVANSSTQNNSSHIVDGYFKRIGYSGDGSISIKTLRDLHFRHTQTIPFENLNSFFGWQVKLDLESIFQKLVVNRRGGYCFEHNLLFMHLLESLGFRVKGLGARVMWNVPAGVTPARGHMLLLVQVGDQKLIADVGFGGLTMPYPLHFETDLKQTTTHERFQITEDDDQYVISAEVRDEWKPLYKFGLLEQLKSDYEVMNYYISTHPASPFTSNLILAKITGDYRYTLRNTDFATHVNGLSERRVIRSIPELQKIIEDTFTVQFPQDPPMHVFAKLFASGQS
jgi:N-hydroxyarylamine O-acetyltransferase